VTSLDVDGLHMRPEGNRAIASLFWDRIVEVIPAAQLTFRALTAGAADTHGISDPGTLARDHR
jgi:hypothetical protein